MRRRGGWKAWVAGTALGIAWCLLAGHAPVRAQWGYPGGYGGYGWGGWVSNPNADWMTGLGNFAQARGQQEVSFAQARAINADTVLKWNKAMRERQRQVDADQAEEGARQAQANSEANRQRSIENGRALNQVLDQILEFNAGGVKAYAAQTPLSADVLRDIPFEAQTEAITICLDQMTGEDGWPEDLQADSLADERQALQKAVDAALAEDTRGEISADAQNAVTDAVSKLRAEYLESADKTTIAFAEADTFLRTLGGLSRMLSNARVRPVVESIESFPGGDIGDLIGFMQAFNLRFGPAKSDRQKELYRELYPMLTAVLHDTSGTRDAQAHAGKIGRRDASGRGLRQAAKEAFQKMPWDHLGGQSEGQK